MTNLDYWARKSPQLSLIKILEDHKTRTDRRNVGNHPGYYKIIKEAALQNWPFISQRVHGIGGFAEIAAIPEGRRKRAKMIINAPNSMKETCRQPISFLIAPTPCTGPTGTTTISIPLQHMRRSRNR
jgi:hypothetical protein